MDQIENLGFCMESFTASKSMQQVLDGIPQHIHAAKPHRRKKKKSHLDNSPAVKDKAGCIGRNILLMVRSKSQGQPPFGWC